MKAWETAVTTLDRLFSTVTSATLLERLKPLYVLVKERNVRKFCETFPTHYYSNFKYHINVIVPCDCADCQLRGRLCFMHQQLQVNRALVPCDSDHRVCLPLVTIKEQPGDEPGEDPQVGSAFTWRHRETLLIQAPASMTRRTAPNPRTC